MRTILLIAVVVLSGLFAIGMTSYLWFSRGTPATHAMLKDAPLPPLIPISELHANLDDVWGFKPSFDGSMVAHFASDYGKPVIRIVKTSDLSEVTVIDDGDIEWFMWSMHNNILRVYRDGRLWSVDPYQPHRDKQKDTTPRGFQFWRIAEPAPNAEGRQIVTTNERMAAAVDVYTTRDDGTGKELLLRNDGQTIDWFINKAREPVIRVDKGNPTGQIYLTRGQGNNAWKELLRVDVLDSFTVLNAPEQTDTFVYALSNRNRDKSALVKVDMKTAVETVVFGDPNVDITDVLNLAGADFSPDVVVVRDGLPRIEPLSERGQVFKRLVEARGNPVDFTVVDRSSDGRFVTVFMATEAKFGAFWLLDIRTETAKHLADTPRTKYNNDLTTKTPVTFKARDGLPIPAFLTLPAGTDGKDLPTVVRVHGGPAWRDIWTTEVDDLFLANRGYAVLSVNFRGSIGYGKSFQQAGFRQYGKAIQDDIVDAANWLVEQGISDKDNMAVMGGSFGGYVSALAMTRDPGLFKAAIAEYAVTDIAYQMRNNPAAWGLIVEQVQRYYGDSENADDRRDMVDRSPVTHASKVTGSLLLIAGKEDNIVGFEQTEEFERALKASGKDVTALYLEKEGHGVTRWQSQVIRARAIETFLAKKIGGRDGGYSWAETAAKYIQ